MNTRVFLTCAAFLLLVVAAMVYSRNTIEETSNSGITKVAVLSEDKAGDDIQRTILTKLDQVASSIDEIRSSNLELSERLTSVENELKESEVLMDTEDVMSSLLNPPTAEESRQAATDFLVNLDTEFMQEEIDASWSIGSETRISDAFQNQDTNAYAAVDIAHIECRSTSCKVDVSYQENEATEEFETQFFIDSKKNGFARVRGGIDPSTGMASYYLSPSTPSNPEAIGAVGVKQ